MVADYKKRVKEKGRAPLRAFLLYVSAFRCITPAAPHGV